MKGKKGKEIRNGHTGNVFAKKTKRCGKERREQKQGTAPTVLLITASLHAGLHTFSGNHQRCAELLRRA